MSNDSSCVRFDGTPLSIEAVCALADARSRAELSDDAAFRAGIARGAEYLDRLLREDGVVYGVTTGYGDSCTVSIPPSKEVARPSLSVCRRAPDGVAHVAACDSPSK
jgi:histidine ammonia-lyase